MNPPGPSGLAFVGNLWQLSVDALKFLHDLEETYGGVVRVKIGPLTYYLISEPELVEQVLWRRSEIYSRASSSNAKLHDITGKSLLTTVGEEWRTRRKLIAPFFANDRLSLQRSTMATLASSHFERWRAPSALGVPIDVTTTLSALTCAIVSRVLFGTAFEDPELEPALANILTHHWKRLKDPFQLAHRFPTCSRKAFEEGNQTVEKIIKFLSEGQTAGSLQDELRRAAGEDSGIRVPDEMVTMLIAGHETTANALGWALHLLAEHPEVQEQLRVEARAAGDPATAASLPIATRVFQESIRLYPPIWLIERQALTDDCLGGFQVPAGSNLIVAPWVLHRSGRFWSEPECFRPERFNDDPPEHVYIPFGIGPHACVGANLALTEGPLILSLAARDWRWRSLPGMSVEPQPGLTLRMKEPLRLHITPA